MFTEIMNGVVCCFALPAEGMRDGWSVKLKTGPASGPGMRKNSVVVDTLLMSMGAVCTLRQETHVKITKHLLRKTTRKKSLYPGWM